jgi:hypothetical protein
MKVGITIDGVIRDFITKFESVYDKYNPLPVEEGEEESVVESSLEIFGHAGETKLNSVEHLNQLHNLIEDMGHTPIVISKELNNSKPATLFFLSKLSSKVNNIIFVRDFDKKWDHVDILITANPTTLDTKPRSKVSIKVINHYNKDCESDYTIIDLKELVDDKKILEKVLNTETVDFEDV